MFYVKVLLTTFLFFSTIISQENRFEVSYGSGTSNFTKFSYSLTLPGNIKSDFKIDRISSKLKETKMEFGGSDLQYFNMYEDSYMSFLMNLGSTTASGISVNLLIGSEFLEINIKRLILALNDWEIFINEDFMRDDFGSLQGEVDFTLSGISFGNNVETSALTDEDKFLFSLLENIDISKLSSNLSYFDNSLEYEGNLITSLGKCDVVFTYLIPKNIYEDVYIKNFEIKITNVDQSLKTFLDVLFASGEIPFTKTSYGYSMKMSGTLNNPRIY